MAEARDRRQWDHTAEVLAMLANTRFGAKEPVSSKQFHPYHQQPERPRRLNREQSRKALEQWVESRLRERNRGR